MSDRREWLSQWCPTCGVSPGNRCRDPYRLLSRRTSPPLDRLHVARGWHERACPACKAPAGERCRTPSGREAARVHTARLCRARSELIRGPEVWEALERRGATMASVPFSGRAGQGGSTGTIALVRSEGEELVDVERWTSRDELTYALEAPVWDRYGTFAGQPRISGHVLWTAENRSVVIVGTRGGAGFEETVR